MSRGALSILAASPVVPTRRGFIKLLTAGAFLVGSLKVAALARRNSSESLVSLEPRSGAAGVEPALQVAKSWTFGEIKRGDCTIAPGGTFTLFSNGAQRWTCNVSSTDTGDEWDGRFEIFNAQGQSLGFTPNFHFDISVSNQSRHWDQSNGPNQAMAAAFSQAHGISFHCSC